MEISNTPKISYNKLLFFIVKKLRMQQKKDKIDRMQRTISNPKHHVKRHNRKYLYLFNLF